MDAKKKKIFLIVCVTVFIVSGFLGAIIGHKSYLNTLGNEITNYSFADAGNFRRRNDKVLSYLYKEGTEQVAVCDILEVSKGAEFFVLKALDEDKNIVDGQTETADVKTYPHLYLFVRVVNYMSAKSHDYFIEIVAEKDYVSDIEQQPLFIRSDGPFIAE